MAGGNPILLVLYTSLRIVYLARYNMSVFCLRIKKKVDLRDLRTRQADEWIGFYSEWEEEILYLHYMSSISTY